MQLKIQTTPNDTPKDKNFVMTTPQVLSAQPPPPSAVEAKITEELAKDRPTIDAAVKSFTSLVVARSMTASATDTTMPRHQSTLLGIVKAGIHNTNNDDETNDGEGKPTASPSASSLSSSPLAPSPQQQALQLARAILRATNTYTFPIYDTVAETLGEKPGTTETRRDELLERAVLARLWNGLVQSEQKPSQFLGRRALRQAWKGLDVASYLDKGSSSISSGGGSGGGETTMSVSASDPDTNGDTTTNDDAGDTSSSQQLLWLQEFERYLLGTDGSDSNGGRVNDDSALIWAADGGQAELARRRQRRINAATERGPSTPS